MSSSVAAVTKLVSSPLAPLCPFKTVGSEPLYNPQMVPAISTPSCPFRRTFKALLEENLENDKSGTFLINLQIPDDHDN